MIMKAVSRMSSCRSRRARKTVDYSYDAFDATIKAALREDKDEPTRNTRSNAFAEARCPYSSYLYSHFAFLMSYNYKHV